MKIAKKYYALTVVELITTMALTILVLILLLPMFSNVSNLIVKASQSSYQSKQTQVSVNYLIRDLNDATQILPETTINNIQYRTAETDNLVFALPALDIDNKVIAGQTDVVVYTRNPQNNELRLFLTPSVDSKRPAVTNRLISANIKTFQIFLQAQTLLTGDGVTRNFTLPFTPLTNIQAINRGQDILATGDASLSDNIVTYNVAPVTNSVTDILSEVDTSGLNLNYVSKVTVRMELLQGQTISALEGMIRLRNWSKP